MNSLVVCVSALVMGCVMVSSADPAPKLPSKKKFHIYLLMGQSNMSGRGKVEEIDKTPHPRVLALSKDGQWIPAIDPLHGDRPNVGVGLGTTFGKVMAERDPDVTIGLVPCAVGGTPLSRWVKGADLYENAQKRAKLAMKDGTIKGILWHQGENDSLTNTTAETYADRLAIMIPDFRKDLGAPNLPFVAGEIGEFLYVRHQTPHAKLINEQLNMIPDRVPHTTVVSAKGLKDLGDQVHFDSAALREFGKRYADAMVQLQKGAGKPKKKK